MELKINFYECITYYYLGLGVEEQQKWGERITYYQAAVDKINECLHLHGKGDSDAGSVGESLRFALDVAVGKLVCFVVSHVRYVYYLYSIAIFPEILTV